MAYQILQDYYLNVAVVYRRYDHLWEKRRIVPGFARPNIIEVSVIQRQAQTMCYFWYGLYYVPWSRF